MLLAPDLKMYLMLLLALKILGMGLEIAFLHCFSNLMSDDIFFTV